MQGQDLLIARIGLEAVSIHLAATTISATVACCSLTRYCPHTRFTGIGEIVLLPLDVLKIKMQYVCSSLPSIHLVTPLSLVPLFLRVHGCTNQTDDLFDTSFFAAFLFFPPSSRRAERIRKLSDLEDSCRLSGMKALACIEVLPGPLRGMLPDRSLYVSSSSRFDLPTTKTSR